MGRVVNQRPHIRMKVGNAPGDRLPDNVEIDAPVLVRRDIAHAPHLLPFDFGVVGEEIGMFISEQCCCLTDHHDVHQNSLLGLAIAQEGLFRHSARVLQNQRGRLGDVLEIVFPRKLRLLAYTGTASLRT